MRLTHYDCGCVHGVGLDRECHHLGPAPSLCKEHRCGVQASHDVTGGVLILDNAAGRYEWLASVFLTGPKDTLTGWIRGERFEPAEGGRAHSFWFEITGGRRGLWLPAGALS